MILFTKDASRKDSVSLVWYTRYRSRFLLPPAPDMLVVVLATEFVRESLSTRQDFYIFTQWSYFLPGLTSFFLKRSASLDFLGQKSTCDEMICVEKHETHDRDGQ